MSISSTIHFWVDSKVVESSIKPTDINTPYFHITLELKETKLSQISVSYVVNDDIHYDFQSKLNDQISLLNYFQNTPKSFASVISKANCDYLLKKTIHSSTHNEKKLQNSFLLHLCSYFTLILLLQNQDHEIFPVPLLATKIGNIQDTSSILEQHTIEYVSVFTETLRALPMLSTPLRILLKITEEMKEIWFSAFPIALESKDVNHATRASFSALLSYFQQMNENFESFIEKQQQTIDELFEKIENMNHTKT